MDKTELVVSIRIYSLDCFNYTWEIMRWVSLAITEFYKKYYQMIAKLFRV
jgi:hypothetical protein